MTTHSPSVASVLLVDDHEIVREGYKSLLQKQPHLRVIAEASNGDEAYRLFKNSPPDLTIMDLSMPTLGGLEAVKRICAWQRDARVLIFTMHQSALFALQAVRAGARGYVTKSSPPSSLLQAIVEVLRGSIALSADIEHELAVGRLTHAQGPFDCLTPREFDVLRMLLVPMSLGDIATALHLSPKTVANIHYSIKAKLEAPTDIALTLMALQYGLVSDARLPSPLASAIVPTGVDGGASSTGAPLAQPLQAGVTRP